MAEKLNVAPHNFYDHKQHMQWKEQVAHSAVPLIPQDMSGGHTKATSASVLQKAFSNPLVPLGMFATVGCLVGMLVSTLRRNPRGAQTFMRGRCIAQGLTVAALVGGAWMFGLTPDGVDARRKQAESLAASTPQLHQATQ